MNHNYFRSISLVGVNCSFYKAKYTSYKKPDGIDETYVAIEKNWMSLCDCSSIFVWYYLFDAYLAGERPPLCIFC